MTRIHDLEGLVNELKGKQYPISIRDVSPHPDAVRLTGTNSQGLPSGMHTGGAWLLNGYIYKPLDARPHAGSLYHYGTLELECLLAMQGLPLFPVNWWVEKHHDRFFLVRPQGHLIPDEIPYSEIDRTKALYVEDGVRALNLRGWELGDPIELASDPGKRYPLYLYDLSNATRMNGAGCCAADDDYRIAQFFKTTGNEWLYKLRCNARKVWSDLLLHPEHTEEHYTHVYASMYRPIWIGLNIKGAHFVHSHPSLQDARAHTWIATQGALPDDLVKRYEFQLGYASLSNLRSEI